MTLLTRLIFASALSFSIAYTQVPGPVALITEATDATITRAGLENVGIPAYPGDLVFAGDTLTQLAGGRVVFSFCPTSAAYRSGEGETKFTHTRVLTDGKSAVPIAHLPFCRLPIVTPAAQREIRTAADRLQLSEQAKAAVQLTIEQRTALEPFDRVLALDPHDLTTRLARAIASERLDSYDGAVHDYAEFLKAAPQAFWAEDEMRKVLTQRDRISRGEGKTLGIVIGISDYPNLPSGQLQYSDRDAEYFYRYLVSPRGGARQADVSLLLNERAKSGDVRTAIANAFAHAKRNDRVVIFIASHGQATLEGNNRGGYILTYDSCKENLPDTAIRMEDFNDVIGGKLRPEQIQMFVDACYSGLIGLPPERHFKGFLADFLDEERPSTQVLGLLASGQKEPSYECSNLESGHGAFTYFVVHGLNASSGKAVDEARGQITVDSLYEYVREHVRETTKDQKKVQTPERRGNIDDHVELAKKDLEGLTLPEASTTPTTCESARGLPKAPSSNLLIPQPANFQALGEAIKKGLILPGLAGGAFEILSKIRQTNTAEEYNQARNQLLAALLDAGQEIILRYLRGEQVHMTRDDFARGEQLYEAAGQLLSGGDSFINARRLFCRGRKLIFENDLSGAITSLHTAIRLDVSGAYSYNALGIAFLTNARFADAVSAFLNAARLAPNWAYAKHNLALAYTQSGQYTPAIATYREAMRLGPAYSYIPFNLGLLFVRLNRLMEARELFQQVLKSSPGMTRAWNAIGLSYFSEGRFDRAEAAYRTALSMAAEQTDRLAVRHDLALVRVQRSDLTEAVALWRLNLAEQPTDLPSLIGLSDALIQQGDKQAALETFSQLLKNKPSYAGARLRYAKLLIDLGRTKEAGTQLEDVLKTTPHSAEANELLGDLWLQGNLGTASVFGNSLQLYLRALEYTDTTSGRRRLKRKIDLLRSN